MKILPQLHNPTALELIKSTAELKYTKLGFCQIKLDAFTLVSTLSPTQLIYSSSDSVYSLEEGGELYFQDLRNWHR